MISHGTDPIVSSRWMGNILARTSSCLLISDAVFVQVSRSPQSGPGWHGAIGCSSEVLRALMVCVGRHLTLVKEHTQGLLEGNAVPHHRSAPARLQWVALQQAGYVHTAPLRSGPVFVRRPLYLAGYYLPCAPLLSPHNEATDVPQMYTHLTTFQAPGAEAQHAMSSHVLLIIFRA